MMRRFSFAILPRPFFFPFRSRTLRSIPVPGQGRSSSSRNSGKNAFNSPDTLGYSSFISASASTMAHMQTSLEYHLLSAGTTYHGASGKKYDVSFPHTPSGTGPRTRVRGCPPLKTSSSCAGCPAAPEGAFSVPHWKG